jgi:hypothetical protein
MLVPSWFELWELCDGLRSYDRAFRWPLTLANKLEAEVKVARAQSVGLCVKTKLRRLQTCYADRVLRCWSRPAAHPHGKCAGAEQGGPRERLVFGVVARLAAPTRTRIPGAGHVSPSAGVSHSSGRHVSWDWVSPAAARCCATCTLLACRFPLSAGFLHSFLWSITCACRVLCLERWLATRTNAACSTRCS